MYIYIYIFIVFQWWNIFSASKFWKAQLAWKEPSITAGPHRVKRRWNDALKGRKSEPTKVAMLCGTVGVLSLGNFGVFFGHPNQFLHFLFLSTGVGEFGDSNYFVISGYVPLGQREWVDIKNRSIKEYMYSHPNILSMKKNLNQIWCCWSHDLIVSTFAQKSTKKQELQQPYHSSRSH